MQSVPNDRPDEHPTAYDDLGGWRVRATQELARLNGEQHARKKKDTIIAIVDAHLAGRSEETVWADRSNNACHRSTWHEKWKKDPLIAEVLAAVDGMADRWRDERAADALVAAAEMLALESPASVRRAVMLRDSSDDDRVQLQAAFGILDRADPKTGIKSSVNVDAYIEEQLGDEEQAAIEAALRKAAAAK